MWSSRITVGIMLAGSLLAGIISLPGCTVLEDRDPCPCYLEVDFSQVDKSIREWQMWLFSPSGELLFKDTVYRRSYSSPYVVEVPRNTGVQCLLWGNARSGTSLNESFSLYTSLQHLPGLPADSLFFSTDTISTMGEESSLKVVPHKEFATVDICLQGWIGVDFDASMELVCGTQGFYVDRRFLAGNVSSNMKLFDMGDYYTQFRGRILRQPDTENIILSLLIKKREIDGSIGETLIDKDIPIGKYLEENGYDMHTPQMSDIVMDVDYSYTSLVIKAEDWEATYSLNEEI